ncbi:MAG: exonuclease SbcCD subunit D [Clostridia bacterium]
MKFFHLADLHLGKSVYEHSLLPDQRHILDQVAAEVRAESPAAVIIAGDVFDRAVPPPEAVRLFGDFLVELKAIDPDLVIAVIPGNHDSATRLAFASGILGLSGVHIRSDAKDAVLPVTVERGGELARFWLLPFLNPGALTPEMLAGAMPLQGGEPVEPSLLRSQAELFAAAVSMIQAKMIADPVDPGISGANKTSGRKKGIATRVESAGELDFGQSSELEGPSSPLVSDILVCHAFAAGGAAGESERVFLGSAELVDTALFEDFDYVALGHLHRCQSAGAKGMYAGSPIAYAFSEGQIDRGFLVVDVHAGSYSSESRLIQPLRRMVRISGSYDQVMQDPRWQEFEADYIEAILDDADAVLNPMGPLRERFPFLLSLKQAAFEPVAGAGEDLDTRQADDQDGTLAEDDFVAFHQELRGCPPSPALMELFSRLYREATDEAR